MSQSEDTHDLDRLAIYRKLLTIKLHDPKTTTGGSVVGGVYKTHREVTLYSTGGSNPVWRTEKPKCGGQPQSPFVESLDATTGGAAVPEDSLSVVLF